MIKIIQRRKIWFALSITMVVVSIAALAMWGLKFGIDFTGGTMMEVGFNETNLSGDEIKDALKDLNLGDINSQSSNANTTFLRFKEVDEATHQSILTALNAKAASKLGVGANAGSKDASAAQTNETAQSPVQVEAQGTNGENANVSVEAAPAAENANSADASSQSGDQAAASAGNKYVVEKSFESVGPSVGNELKTSAVWAILIAVTAIILYIAWAFRKVSYPVSSFKYGLVAALALLHDVLITVGAFAILGHVLGVEIGISFVAALLTILGYSVHDTIVVFDRIRENLFKAGWSDFEETVNNCINETLIRSVNTSFTVVLTLSALFLFGGASIRYFVLALMIGIVVGTYSSIFIASPLLVTWQRFDEKRKIAK